MEDRNAFLIRYLRSCATAETPLQVDTDLMREAADEFEKLLPAEESFKDTTDELHFNIVRAEQHARQAHDLLYLQDGPKRSVWFKMALGRAQSILMSLYKQELARRK
jgi:hypothetical protein